MAPRSIPADRPIDAITIEILRAVALAAGAQGADHMLVGATARDVLLTHVFGLPASRATRDVDFAVAVKDWAHFDALREQLIARGTFRDGGDSRHRMYFKGPQGLYDYHIDLVPFGAISNATNEVVWPPDLTTIMNVAGFDDALMAAELVEFEPGLIQKVASIPGLAVLKIIAWSDRGRATSKDAQDLIWIMDNYAAAGNNDRIYEVEGVIEAGDYAPDAAGVYLLGLDIGRIASEETLNELRKIIKSDFERLSLEMVKSQRHLENVEERVTLRLRLLQSALA